jgi:hypothetical protein
MIRFVTRLTRRVPLVEQELLTLPENLSSPTVFSRVRVTWSLVLCICFVDRGLSFCTFSFDHCVFCSSSIYGFWLPLWYLQTLHFSHTHTRNSWIYSTTMNGNRSKRPHYQNAPYQNALLFSKINRYQKNNFCDLNVCKCLPTIRFVRIFYFCFINLFIKIINFN